QRHERLPQGGAPVDTVPARQEPPECRLLGRLDLLPQPRERCPAQAAQDVRIAPFALAAARAQLTPNEQLLAFELAQHGIDVDPEARIRIGSRERPAALRVAEDERAQR